MEFNLEEKFSLVDALSHLIKVEENRFQDLHLRQLFNTSKEVMNYIEHLNELKSKIKASIQEEN